ncbi:hypothetical protein N2152v2_007000 [Parachlorella kessleri]
MATAVAKQTATNGAALRSKLFGGGNSTAVAFSAPTTDSLKQTTDRLIKEQSQQAAAVELYRAKLGEAQTHVRRLEGAYLEQAQINSQLQAKVKDDHKQLEALISRVVSIQSTHAELERTCRGLQSELLKVEEERVELQGAFDNKVHFSEDLAAKLEKLAAHAAGLEGKLEEVHRAQRELSEELAASKQAEASKQQEIAKIQGEMHAARSQSEASITHLEAQLAAAQRQCSELEASLAAARTKLAEDAAQHEASVARLSADIARSQAEAACLGEQLGQQTAAAAALKEELASMGEAKAGLEETVKAKEEALAAMDVDISSTKAELEQAESKLEEQTNLCEETTKELEALKLVKDRLDTEADARSAVLAALEAKYSALELQSSNEKEGLEAQKAVLEARLSAAAVDGVTWNQRCAELTQQLEEQQMVADKQHEVYTVRTGKMVEEIRTKHKAELDMAKKMTEDLLAKMQAMQAKHAREVEAYKVLQDAAVLQERYNAGGKLIEKEAQIDAMEKAHAAQVEELRAATTAGMEKADKEKGALELRLDELNEKWRQTQMKLAALEAESSKKDDLLHAKDSELATQEDTLLRAKERLEAVELELKKKASLLAGISIAANASVKPPTAPADHQAQPQGGAKRHRVQFQELDAEDPHSDVDEETAEQDEEEHVPKPSQALVVRQPVATQQAEQLPKVQPQQAPLVTEPASDSDGGSSGEEDGGSDDDEERQARGRKRSGKAISMKGNKKTKKAPVAKPTISAGRRMGGMFGHATASQGNKETKATSGGRKRATKPDAKLKQKKAAPPAFNADKLQSGLLNLFGGLGDSYDVPF